MKTVPRTITITLKDKADTAGNLTSADMTVEFDPEIAECERTTPAYALYSVALDAILTKIDAMKGKIGDVTIEKEQP